MNEHINRVPLEKAYRLINHGPTALVSARANGTDNVMTAAWVCGLDFQPPKLTAVLDKIAKTRSLIEQSGTFVIQIPTVSQIELTHYLGTHTLAQEPDKLQRAGATLFEMRGIDAPFVSGCAAWLACRLIPEPHNQQQYDLFIGEVTAAWADSRVFKDGHWYFDQAPAALRTLHYVAGGQFYATGESLNLNIDS